MISATPRVRGYKSRNRIVREDEVPDPIDLPEGCFYRDRCPFEVDECKNEAMQLRSEKGANNTDQVLACHRAVNGEIDFKELEDSNLAYIQENT